MRPSALELDWLSKEAVNPDRQVVFTDVFQLAPAARVPGFKPFGYLRKIIPAALFHADEPDAGIEAAVTQETGNELLEEGVVKRSLILHQFRLVISAGYSS